MNTRNVVCIALASTAFATGLGAQMLSVAAAGGPNPDPDHVAVIGNKIVIMPTGIDDTANLEWAMANVNAGGVVRLEGESFRVSEAIDAINFNGSLVGLGADKTTIHLLDGFGTSELLMPWPMPWGLVLYYNPDYPQNWTGQAKAALRGFAIVADGDAGGYPGFWGAEVSGVYVTGDLFESGGPAPYEKPAGVDLTFEGLIFKGSPYAAADELHPTASTMYAPFIMERFHGGTHRIRQVRVEDAAQFGLAALYDCDVDVADLSSVVTEGPGPGLPAVWLFQSGKCQFAVRRLHTVGRPGVWTLTGPSDFWPTPTDPSVYMIDQCEINQPAHGWWGALELSDSAAPERSEFIVTGNRIRVDLPTWPILFIGVEDALVAHNQIVASGATVDDHVAIVLDEASLGNRLTTNKLTGGGLVVAGSDNEILGNQVEAVPGDGLVVAGDRNHVLHNAFRQISGNGIVLTGDENEVRLNIFKDVAGEAVVDLGAGNITSTH
jgi:hypothetical protein